MINLTFAAVCRHQSSSCDLIQFPFLPGSMAVGRHLSLAFVACVAFLTSGVIRTLVAGRLSDIKNSPGMEVNHGMHEVEGSRDDDMI